MKERVRERIVNTEKIFTKHETLERRRELRRNSTPSEKILWNYLRAGRFEGIKFRRQHGVLHYILDFYCSELKLAIEIDGSSHDSEEAQEYDAERQSAIENLGIQFLRFTNEEIEKHTEGVLETIRAWIFSSSP